MIRRLLPILLLLAVVIAAPILMRRSSELAASGKAEDRLIIITPHNETIRSEFSEAFARHWKQKTGRTLYIDWRIPGGTSDIKRVIDSSFKAADEIRASGIGVDIFFGGGEPDFKGQADQGRFVPLEVFTQHPEWFEGDVIPAKFTGENYYDAAKHLWVGTCLSQMGICYNKETVQRLGLLPPRRWDDLTDPAYAGYIALADPTKSGSVGRTYELMIQEQMKRVIQEKGASQEALEEGWRHGLNLLQAMAANARYYTDSASKIPHDVAQGDAAAGTCIDFYGRSYEEKLGKRGPSRLLWIAPLGGTSISVDPIAVFRGAPREDIAQEFVTYCLSDAGQLLWNVKAGQPGGPRETSPRRLPVRRDLYTVANLPHFADPDALPYERSGGFEYDPALTGKAFNALRQIFRAMCMDPHQEMKAAWDAIRVSENAGSDSTITVARAAFFDTSHLSYDRVMNHLVPLLARERDPKDATAKLDISREMARISEAFRANYIRAAEIAKEGGQP
jgi:iron(III) transport system substrate-binding protein